MCETKTRFCNLVFVSWDLLLRRDNCHDEIHQKHGAVEGEESQHEHQADDDGVDVEIITHACARWFEARSVEMISGFDWMEAMG
jgi:hypothetical protein